MSVNSFDLGLKAILFGGINVLFKTEEPYLHLICAPEHRLFENTNSPEVTIAVKTGKIRSFSIENPSFKTTNCSFYRENEFSSIRILTPGRPSRRSYLSLSISADNSKGELLFEDVANHKSTSINLIVPPFALDELMAVHLLGLERGIMFHSCGIRSIHNKGLLFTGISGAGKSSTARLWQESGKGTLLGDERVVIRKRKNQFWLISTAWHGKGPLVGPAETPLDYLFILRHASENQATRLKPSESVAQLMARSFLPFWDRNAMEFSLQFLEEISSKIPCYDYGFSLDQSAVDYVECLISS